MLQSPTNAFLNVGNSLETVHQALKYIVREHGTEAAVDWVLEQEFVKAAHVRLSDNEQHWVFDIVVRDEEGMPYGVDVSVRRP